MSFTVLTGFQYFILKNFLYFLSQSKFLFSRVVLGKDKPKIYFHVDNQIFASRRLVSRVEG